jgi:hypothetical protein
VPSRAKFQTPETSGRKPPLAVAVFARAAVPGRAKTRLIPLLGPHGAAELQSALLRDALRKVDTLAGVASPWLFLTGSRFHRARGRRRWTVAEQRGRDLGQRLNRAFRRMLSRHSAAIIIGTDSPLLPPRTLRQAWSELVVCDAVLGPCPDGGYYLIGLRRLAPGLFHRVRWSTRFAFRDTRRQLLRHGFACSVLASVPDMDRPRDFRELAQQMTRQPSIRALAPATWRFLKGAGKGWK